MGKKVLIITSSFRHNSNSELLAKEFGRGAEEAGNEVEYVSLANKNLGFCRGCYACLKTLRCVQKDDADEIEQKMEKADVLVFATPIYYYEMSGQMKTMLDRGNPLYNADYAFRSVYMLASGAAEAESACEVAVKGLEGWVKCFKKAHLDGVVFAGGVDAPGSVKDHPAMKKAYEMGKKIQ